MWQDIGVAAPLYDLCKRLAIKDVYKLPVHIIPWQMPYPINVEWPVIEYGDSILHEDRKRGIIKVEPGGKAKLWITTTDEAGSGVVLHNLTNVSEAATRFRMGPRPLFSRPCIAVCITHERIGVLMPKPMNSDEDAMPHALHRLCMMDVSSTAASLEYACYNPVTKRVEDVSHDWVEGAVLAIGTNVLIKAWCDAFKPFLMHIPRRPSGRRTQAAVKEDGVHVCGVLCPPRDAHSYMQKVWVSVEVRHQNGSLRGLAHADMISLAISPDDLLLKVEGVNGVNGSGGGPSNSSKLMGVDRDKGSGKRPRLTPMGGGGKNDGSSGSSGSNGSSGSSGSNQPGKSGASASGAVSSIIAGKSIVVDFIHADKYACE